MISRAAAKTLRRGSEPGGVRVHSKVLKHASAVRCKKRPELTRRMPARESRRDARHTFLTAALPSPFAGRRGNNRERRQWKGVVLLNQRKKNLLTCTENYFPRGISLTSPLFPEHFPERKLRMEDEIKGQHLDAALLYRKRASRESFSIDDLMLSYHFPSHPRGS